MDVSAAIGFATPHFYAAIETVRMVILPAVRDRQIAVALLKMEQTPEELVFVQIM